MSHLCQKWMFAELPPAVTRTRPFGGCSHASEVIVLTLDTFEVHVLAPGPPVLAVILLNAVRLVKQSERVLLSKIHIPLHEAPPHSHQARGAVDAMQCNT